MFDMHCHVDLIDPMSKFCAATEKLNISILAMTTIPRAYEAERRILSSYPTIYIALGFHPQLVADRKNELALFDKYVSSSKYIGEVGLDFSKRFYFSKKEQTIAFEHIIQSCIYSKTISIHSVFSDRYVLDILERNNTTEHNNCILHWYSGSFTQLERAIEMGCYFSVNEQMLNSPNGTKIIARIPIERLVLESDAPFVGNIKTAEALSLSLAKTSENLCRIKQEGNRDLINYTSRKLLGSNI